MRTTDRYQKRIEWSDEDDTSIGKCPDVISGVQGDEAIEPYCELREAVNEVRVHFECESRPLPPVRVGPLQEVS